MVFLPSPHGNHVLHSSPSDSMRFWGRVPGPSPIHSTRSAWRASATASWRMTRWYLEVFPNLPRESAKHAEFADESTDYAKFLEVYRFFLCNVCKWLCIVANESANYAEFANYASLHLACVFTVLVSFCPFKSIFCNHSGSDPLCFPPAFFCCSAVLFFVSSSCFVSAVSLPCLLPYCPAALLSYHRAVLLFWLPYCSAVLVCCCEGQCWRLASCCRLFCRTLMWISARKTGKHFVVLFPCVCGLKPPLDTKENRVQRSTTDV